MDRGNQPNGFFESDLEVFDGPALLDRVAGDRDLALKVIQTYLESAPGTLAALEEALRTRDAGQIVHQLHSLRGASASVGAMQVQAGAARVEARASAGDWAELALLVRQVRQALDRFKALAASAGGF
jgi:HPt (histidine-containing phosphotransfer) domain-containing protein